MCAKVWISVGVCLVLFIERALGECLLPKHPAHGRHVAHGGDCGGQGRPKACDGTPGTPAPDDWLLVVRCDPGYQPENPNDSDVPSICNNGVWSNQHLPRCIIPDLLINETQRCIVPSPPPHSKYRMFPEECGADTLPPGSQVPQDCILFLNCATGYQRKLGKGDFLTHCTNKTWSPSIPKDLCISKVEISEHKEGDSQTIPSRPNPATITTHTDPRDPIDCVLPDTSPSRRFCSLESGCAESCTFHNYRCLVSSGSKVNRVKVVCNEGYTTGISNGVSVCVGNVFYPPLPKCLKLCPPRKSEMLQLTCRLGSAVVNCDEWAVPNTTVTIDCAQTFSQYPDLIREGKYSRPQYCTRDGEWSDRLPICKPACGVFNKNIKVIIATIVNGDKANLGFFPWHAGIYYREEEDGKVTWDQKCGGSLINDQFVLTAAHCLSKYTQEVSHVRIALGKYYRSWDRPERTEEKRNVLAISIPSSYASATYTFDIALVLLSERIKFGQYIMPVCRDFDTSPSDFRNKDLFVVGWGRIGSEQNAKSSEELLYSTVTSLSDTDCRRRVPAFYTTFEKICGVKSNSVSVTQPGDSGGGMTAVYGDGLHYLVGIVSTKVDENLSVFTNTKWKTHVDWIDSEITRLKNLHFL